VLDEVDALLHGQHRAADVARRCFDVGAIREERAAHVRSLPLAVGLPPAGLGKLREVGVEQEPAVLNGAAGVARAAGFAAHHTRVFVVGLQQRTPDVRRHEPALQRQQGFLRIDQPLAGIDLEMEIVPLLAPEIQRPEDRRVGVLLVARHRVGIGDPAREGAARNPVLRLSLGARRAMPEKVQILVDGEIHRAVAPGCHLLASFHR
jgi:hypothetical protein